MNGGGTADGAVSVSPNPLIWWLLGGGSARVLGSIELGRGLATRGEDIQHPFVAPSRGVACIYDFIVAGKRGSFVKSSPISTLKSAAGSWQSIGVSQNYFWANENAHVSADAETSWSIGHCVVRAREKRINKELMKEKTILGAISQGPKPQENEIQQTHVRIVNNERLLLKKITTLYWGSIYRVSIAMLFLHLKLV